MIEDVIKFPAEPAGLYDPLRYMMDIGGKRLRPRLCMTVFGLYGKEPGPDVLEPSAAIELFHTYSLIHDDIMDRSPLRRGVPTVWKKWDETTAILSGDVMLIEAYKHIAKAPAACLDRALELFSKTAAEVCEGQQYDMDFESLDTVPMAGYEKMIGLKTAVLIACAAKMGALVAGAPEAECEAFYRYGYGLGMAFQVADDLLDAYGDEKVFGKPIGGDILNEKKSWLTVRTLEKTVDPEAFLKIFKRKCSSPEDEKQKIAAVKAIYDKLGVPEDARAEIERYSAGALEAISGVSVDTAPLKEFADKLIGRVR
ncbi:MAG: polyprenyl synthetase family protein [Bacteroidales bacterium]|nr:polyprenyl synthetase family protein [Bacteroidales bacterium]